MDSSFVTSTLLPYEESQRQGRVFFISRLVGPRPPPSEAEPTAFRVPTARLCSTKILNVGLLLFRGLTVVLLFMFNMNNSRGLPTRFTALTPVISRRPPPRHASQAGARALVKLKV